MDGTPVYSYKDSYVVTHNVWKEKDICYILRAKDAITDKDSIDKEFIAKTLE